MIRQNELHTPIICQNRTFNSYLTYFGGEILLLLDLDIPNKAASDILVPLNSSVNSSVNHDEKDQSEDLFNEDIYKS